MAGLCIWVDSVETNTLELEAIASFGIYICTHRGRRGYICVMKMCSIERKKEEGGEGFGLLTSESRLDGSIADYDL